MNPNAGIQSMILYGAFDALNTNKGNGQPTDPNFFGLDQKEIAAGVLKYGIQGSPDYNPGLAGTLATFITGGVQQTGLTPDSKVNADGFLDRNEIGWLASMDGDSNTIGNADFKALFPGQARDAGTPIDFNRIYQIAGVQPPTQPPGTNPPGTQPPTTPPGTGINIDPNMLATLAIGLMNLLTALIQQQPRR
jgi:hypothetical protein